MELHYLGTAAAEGWPGLFCRCEACRRARQLGGKNIRTRHSALLDGIIKFDFNADTYLQVLRDGLDLGAVEHLLITHSHPDHLNPFDLWMRAPVFAHGLDRPLHLYGNDRVLALIQQLVPDLGKGEIHLHLVHPFTPFEAGDAAVIPLRASHTPLETCLNYLVTRDGKTLLYAHDTGWWPEETWRFIARWAKEGGRIHLASFDCTFGNEDEGRYHMGIPVVTRMRDRLQELGALADGAVCVLSHFSHNGRLMHHEFEAIANPLGYIVAYDGLKVSV